MSKSKYSAQSFEAYAELDKLALILRIGIGSVFVIGGWNKLYQLLSSRLKDKIIASYTGTTGCSNQFFTDWMFGADALFTQWGFLTALSAFELISGIALLVGLMVRPLAIIYAFLMWTFVVSLPVITTPGAEFAGKTYLAPALFVQVRDIALSGMMFVLYNLGSGAHSVDERLFGKSATEPLVNWESLGLLMRLSIGIIFIIAGFFAGMPNIKTFDIPAFFLVIVGAGLVAGISVRVLGAVVMGFMIYYIMTKLTLSKSIIGNLNGIKREFAFFAGGLVLALKGGGRRFTLVDIYERFSGSITSFKQHQKT